MTAASDSSPGRASIGALEAEARALAEAQRQIEPAKLVTRRLAPATITHALERAHTHLAETASAGGWIPKATEWYLDNYYLIRRVARQVDTDLPRAFVRHLPLLGTGPMKGRPTIDAMARALVAKTGVALDLSILRRFVDAYQEASPLTIAELWALPTLLRAAALRHLLQFLGELHLTLRWSETGLATRLSIGVDSPKTEPLALDATTGVERSIRTLRALAVIDWKAFFEATSRIEAILRTDPAQVYERMDFDTCDAYRKVIECLALGSGVAEEDVAQLVVSLARGERTDDRRGHVGYFLLAEGRRDVEARLGYRSGGVERAQRALKAWPTTSYLLPLAALTVIPSLTLAWGVAHIDGGARLTTAVAALVLSIVPISAVAVAVVQVAFARFLPPCALPKLNFERGLTSDSRTLVVIPTLLTRVDDVATLVRQLELQFLSNPDTHLQFALLTDDADAKMPPDASSRTPAVEAAALAITALNDKHGTDGRGPFHLLHREPQWNPGEERFMGWERKRGKLDELNRLLRGATGTSYCVHIGDPSGLLGIRFVITLDSDTQLPIGSAHRLIGLIAHPLNRAVFDAVTRRVAAGYTIVQPRVETSPSSPRQTWFSRLFAGDVGFDIYTHASSELYQDLFGHGIYVGKGIYDVDAFMRSVDGRVPENALVSHDLFEGVHGRTALATDILLFESYPANYLTYALRMHRWIRGDWQLLPWLCRRAPSAGGGRDSNTLSRIDRWKIADNLRRSLTSPMLLAGILLGWTLLPGNPLLWTLGSLALLAAPSASGLLSDRHRVVGWLGRCALATAFLPYESFLAIDAVVRVLVRTLVTRKHLLEWTSAAQTSAWIETVSTRGLFWRTMSSSPCIALCSGALVAIVRPGACVAATPLLVLWMLAPEIARWVSEIPSPRAEYVTEDERRALRLVARRTWGFFDAFVGPNDQWLPIDNHQEEPREQTAHRTSPTNIGLMLTATLSAYDFGYLGPRELSIRLRRAFDSISRLQHYQGHLLNWYDTKSLEPLLPKYVSTVDSGNFAGCLIALKHGCVDVASSPIVRREAWEGLRDAIQVLDAAVEPAPASIVRPLRELLARMTGAALRARDNLDESGVTLRVLCDATLPELDAQLHAFLDAGAHPHEADTLRALRASVDGLHRQLSQMRGDLDALAPWLALEALVSSHGLDVPSERRLCDLPSVAERLLAELDAREATRRERGQGSPDLDASAGLLRAALSSAAATATGLLGELHSLAARADEEVREMDFKLLYDAERRLFHIGYNATTDQVDPHHYDLLASEARLASYLAIVKRDVPESHWYALGRPMTHVGGSAGLLSWGGTMFEYLMPNLLMRSQEGTLLARTCAVAVDAQIEFGKKCGSPWGVSESAFARVDAGQTYQYRSFGVPGLGFKRGLDADRVVASYASLLAVSIRPHAVVANVAALESLAMLGTYGLFEALDLTPDRVTEVAPSGRRVAVVRSYMAHHQGMILVAIGNVLNDRSMVARFHSDSAVATGEALLNERVPETAPDESPLAERSKPLGTMESDARSQAPAPWHADDRTRPQAFVLSNGRLSSMLTSSGGGGLFRRGIALTRYEPDVTVDDGGWFYVRDEESGQLWRATSTEGRTTYSIHKAEFHHREHGISTHVDVTVAAADDVEVRQITVHNESSRARRITVTSAATPALFDPAAVSAHPAFTSMFVESERAGAIDGLLFSRRRQKVGEDTVVLVHRLVRDAVGVTFVGFETDRAVFFGRGGSRTAPLALATAGSRLRGRVGAMLDPIMCLMAHVELKPKGAVTFAFVTTVARSRGAALDLARKYGTLHAVRWAFVDAEQEATRRLRRAAIDPDLLPTIQRLFSALVFIDAAVRQPSEVRAAAHACQHRLWGRGISGDDPIVLVRVADPSARVLHDVLAAQRFLRACGVRMDLVLIDEQATAYVTDGAGTLRSTLVRENADEWLSRRGGVYVIPADQGDATELRHLEACARVVLDTRDVSLDARLDAAIDSPPKLPRFERTFIDETAAVSLARARPTLVFDNGIGGFAEDGREYVISLGPGQVTPAPWSNVLANPQFGCLVDEACLGSTWSLNSGENRLTPWRNDTVFDAPSEVLYLRDEETAAVWSPTPRPAGRAEHTLIRHGAGYTVYERETHGLIQELTIFVPFDASLKVARLRLKNTQARHRRLTATYYAEWVLGSRREVQRPYIVSEFDREHGCLLATCDWSAEFGGRVAFLAAGGKVHGFTGDRTEFLGRRGDYAHPQALERWGMSDRTDLGVDPCAALQLHVELAPGEETQTHFILGQSKCREDALQLVRKFQDRAEVDIAWTRLGEYWDSILGNICVKTPEPAMDLMVNRWLLYQALSARIFGRTGFYQSSGAFGYRDQLQDVLALLHAAPELARKQIVEAASHQFEAGDVLHWWHPPSGRGVRTRCSDDMAWLPYVAAEYVVATGDDTILDERVPFLRGDALKPGEHDRYAKFEVAPEPASVFEHCRRALERATTEGPHGLPLMGDGDWNDGMNRVGAEGRGESVWLGWFLVATMRRFGGLAGRRGDSALAASWQQRAETLRARVQSVAWDGAWYLRAFHDDGSLVGSAKSRECRIDSIAQSWAVLSESDADSDDTRARDAVRAADDQLVRDVDRLVLLFWPPFDSSTLHDPGYVRAYPPGVRENGGQYTHAAAWLGFAHAALADGERAERMFRLLNPVLRARTPHDAARYRIEPYVLAGDIYSCPPWVGRGGWSWYTGAAAWTWRLGVEAILGLRLEDGNLRISPCIPATWIGFEAWVTLGRERLHIVVENSSHPAGDTAATFVAGAESSHLIRLNPSATGCRDVRVRLAAGARPASPSSNAEAERAATYERLSPAPTSDSSARRTG